MEGDGVSVSRAGEMISRAPSSTPPLESFLRCPPLKWLPGLCPPTSTNRELMISQVSHSG